MIPADTRRKGKMKYQLIDAEKRHKQNSESFWIPSLEERQDIDVGQWVKLIFKGKEGTERMWVKVTGGLVGTLDNDPVLLPLSHGDTVTFEYKHIIEILDDEELAQPAGSIRE